MKNIKSIFVFALTLAVLFSFSGCKGSGFSLFNPDYPVKVSDITLKKAPTRIISLSAATTSVLFFMGYSDRIVAIDSDYIATAEAEITKLPRAGNALMPDEKTILDQNPDLIITTTPITGELKEKLKLRDTPVAVLPAPTKYSDLAAYYTNIATLLSGKKSGKQIAGTFNDGYKENLNRITKFTSGKTPVPACLIIEKGYVATGNSFLGDVLSKSGAKNIAKDRTDYKMNNTELAAAAPEVIFCPKGLSAELLADKTLANVPAVKQKKVYEIDVAGLGTMGGSLMDTMFTMTDKLYPGFSASVNLNEPE